MKNADVIAKLGELSIRYGNEGLIIAIEFDRFGMTLRGYLDRRLREAEIHYYKHEYSHELLKSLADDMDIETLVDSFKEEVFDTYRLQCKK